MIIRFVIYGALGCFMEVVWTGLSALLNKNFTMKATTSLWMFFIYGMVICLEPVFQLIAPLPIIMRGLTYAAIIFAGEFLTGSVLKTANICPWDYSSSRYHVKGLIRWDYAPAWALAGLIFERAFWMLV